MSEDSSDLDDKTMEEIADTRSDDTFESNHGLVFSLFDDFSSNNVQHVWDHMRNVYGFDLKELKKSMQKFHDYSHICLINFLRTQQEKKIPTIPLISQLQDIQSQWNNETFLQLVNKNDPLLWDLPQDFDISDNDDIETPSFPENFFQENNIYGKRVDAVSKETTPCDQKPLKTITCLSQCDANYFDSYNDLNIHRTMISDTARTNAYRTFIDQSRDYFNGKVVLDVGSGTGILSMFCAQAGARLVIGVEAAESILHVAQRVAEKNHFKNVFFIPGKIENLNIWFISEEKMSIGFGQKGVTRPTHCIPFACDIIISEWMGYGLFYEWMLLSIIDARDRFLKCNGLLVPCEASIEVFAADLSQELYENLYRWDDTFIYGLDLSDLKPNVQDFFSTAYVMDVSPKKIVSEPTQIFQCNLKEISKEDLSQLQSSFSITTKQCMTSLVFSFRCTMHQGQQTVYLDTSPLLPSTHWKQVVCHLKQDKPLGTITQVVMNGVVFMAISAHSARALTIIIDIKSYLINNKIQWFVENNKYILK